MPAAPGNGPGGQDLQQHDARHPDDLGLRGYRAGARAGPRRRAAVRDQPASSGQCWSLTSYCPVPGPVPGAPAEPRLPARLHHGDDAEGPEAGPGRRRSGRRAARHWVRKPCQLYNLFAAGGNEGLDFSAIIKMIEGEGRNERTARLDATDAALSVQRRAGSRRGGREGPVPDQHSSHRATASAIPRRDQGGARSPRHRGHQQRADA